MCKLRWGSLRFWRFLSQFHLDEDLYGPVGSVWMIIILNLEWSWLWHQKKDAVGRMKELKVLRGAWCTTLMSRQSARSPTSSRRSARHSSGTIRRLLVVSQFSWIYNFRNGVCGRFFFFSSLLSLWTALSLIKSPWRQSKQVRELKDGLLLLRIFLNKCIKINSKDCLQDSWSVRENGWGRTLTETWIFRLTECPA